MIVHTGDVSLDPDYVPALRRHGPDAVWDGVREAFHGADVVAVNLECPVGEGGVAQDKQFVFRCDPAALPAMRDAGVDLVTLANNHAGDHGLDLMLASVERVERTGLRTVGVGPDEARAHEPQFLDVAGWRVAVLGFGGVVPEPDWIAYGDAPGQATGYDAERMARSVARAKADADLVVVSVHWGEEGALEPRPEDRQKAQAMAAAGADVVFGHHAHRLQPVEQVDGAAVFWNLGNFVWPRFSDDGARTALARWTVEPDGTTSACLVPAEIDDDGVPRLTDDAPTCLPTSLPPG
ncbi:CapA family protein [Egicoccus sp. AB-alg2]|uniref:CapA family protein n=1 Tax=Egicoccus sp. AB-alg2 TaxID=3242693 RepID=UPI00359DD943